ncbi:helix-turn-helix domain-containing protein [Kribbella sp. NBC_01510]|uniref:helix-turn-helix transcriptional regulator n=1 Tax=Kribbella sp. NBC_01510 TaxID=2903581 RepID=UPI00386F5968
MENNHPANAQRPGYGPTPSTGRARAPLSKSRAALLETLRAQTEATTLMALVTATGLHANTVREHLEALVRDGFAHRHQAAPAGRGRPAWLYEATGSDAAAAPEYAGLAAALAATIHRTSASPHEDAVTAGVEWGHQLARARGAEPASSPAAARREVVSLFDEIGFGPRADARSTVVRLTRCPLLEAAHQYPDVVCGVHLGLAQGALEEYGAVPEGTELRPFAEPGACRLHLKTRSR